MKVRSLVLVLIVGFSMQILGCSLISPKKPPVYTQTFQKAGWIDQFAPGRSQLGLHQKMGIYEISRYVKDHPRVTVVFKGSVSEEKIRDGNCSTADDGKDFFLDQTGDVSIKDERKCEQALGGSRAMQCADELMSYHAVTKLSWKQVVTFTDVDFGTRSGGHDLNRAVSYWYIELPENAIIQRLTEKSETGELVVSYTEEYKSPWEQLKAKQARGEIFKSRIRERREQNPK